MTSTDTKSDCKCSQATPPTSATPGVSRRNLLLKVGAGLNAAAAVLMGVPLLGYVLSTFARKSQTSWISLGNLDTFPQGETRLATYRNPAGKPWDGDTSQVPCWVRRIDPDNFQVFAINCTHLGCPVRWFQEARLFMCPCHGGAFYEDGSHASGPPPRGLFEYQHKIDSGQLKVLGGHLPTLAEPL
jgi:menaquinol-cytochrome c reductase iron-sulfur subunit